MDPLKQVQPETVNRKVALKQPLKVTPKSDLLHLEARRCSYTGPTRGHEPRCVSVAGPFNAMKSPVGFRGYEGASFSDTQLMIKRQLRWTDVNWHVVAIWLRELRMHAACRGSKCLHV